LFAEEEVRMNIWNAVESRGYTMESATFAELRAGRISEVASTAGVYMVPSPTAPPRFTDESVGGRFKDRDPSVPTAVLETKWVQGAPVLYIGKADQLRRRIREFCAFGAGSKIGHWGGRYIWQLEGCQELIVAWVPTPGEDPREVERLLLKEFESEFASLPFANLTR
jgi:hypothetical protein